MKRKIILACLLLAVGLQSCYVEEHNGHRYHHWGHRHHHREEVIIR